MIINRLLAISINLLISCCLAIETANNAVEKYTAVNTCDSKPFRADAYREVVNTSSIIITANLEIVRSKAHANRTKKPMMRTEIAVHERP